MSTLNQNVLDDQFQSSATRRRDLLPVWIKIFTWIFMVFGMIAPIAIVLGLSGTEFTLSLYGLETYQPISVLGLTILSLFIIKTIVAVGLWTEKSWAITLAIYDAIAGIAVCVFTMAVLPFIMKNGLNINFRLELLILIPYLIKLYKIKPLWEDKAN